MIGSILDTVLDRSVVGGYTRLGYRLRSPWWDDGPDSSMAGKVVLITGATSGLGLAAATGFARLGASVHLLARDASRGEDARATVAEQAQGGEVRLELCDLAQLESVREFAQRFTATTPRLDVLVNNAGVMTSERTLSADGIELTFAVNVVAGFLLTEQLLGPLRAPALGRIVNVSSGGMYTQRLDTDDLRSEHNFDGTAAYARSKRAQVILTEMWAQRLAAASVVVHAMHPGWADTPGVRSSLPRFYRLTRPLLRTPAQGADTIVWLGSARSPGASSGRFWHDRAQRPAYLLPGTRESQADRERLWTQCERLAGTGSLPAEYGLEPNLGPIAG
ncbi:MAG: SDR family NAD(P)-dependent oxidoreductase [Actinomycetota bacterium]|nr:SDR family NAD(P)-dependent oxidoreductase [Actinomycetota bacterium]